MDFKQKCGNPTVGCGMLESSSAWNPTDSSGILQTKIIRFFCRAGLHPNYLISSNQKTWYYKLLLNAEFPYCRIQDGSVGFWGLGDSDIPQPTVGLPHFGVKSIGPPVIGLKRLVCVCLALFY